MSSILKLTNGGLPMHLGGHEEETHLDEGALDYLIKTFDIKSMIDIGCGPGGMIELARSKGLDVVGVDGDFVVKRNVDDVVIHDYQAGPYVPDRNFDLAWTVEFVEHIEEQYIRNFVATMDKCKYVIMTHAFPNQPGWHHVNCQTTEYWAHMLNAFGFSVDVEHTNNVRNASTMKTNYIRQQSLFLVNRNYGKF
jgi:SAM-dependent methyltransferase